MIVMNEEDQVRKALQHADTGVTACNLRGDWKGVVVEIANGKCADNTQFEGTMIYFPGVTLKELQVP